MESPSSVVSAAPAGEVNGARSKVAAANDRPVKTTPNASTWSPTTSASVHLVSTARTARSHRTVASANRATIAVYAGTLDLVSSALVQKVHYFLCQLIRTVVFLQILSVSDVNMSWMLATRAFVRTEPRAQISTMATSVNAQQVSTIGNTETSRGEKVL